MAEDPCHWIHVGDFEWWALNRKTPKLLAPKTISTYLQWITHCERALRLEGICLTEVAADELLSYFDGLRPTPSLRLSVRSSLIACFEFLIWSEIRDDNPALKLPKWKEHRGVPRPLPKSQVGPLVQAANEYGPMWGCLVTVYLYTGVRATELRNRHWSHVIDDRLYVIRKGGKKSVVFLPPQALESIDNWRAVAPASRWMFPSNRIPDAPITYNWTWRKLRELGDSVGIDECRMHRLRHTFATEYRRQDPNDLWGLAEALGHSDLQSVIIYAGAQNERREATISKLFE